MVMFDTLIHRLLRVPYTLHVHVDKKPKKYKNTVVFLHGIGNSGAAWDSVTAKLPDNVRVLSFDLLGFGRSPRPHWAIYDVRTQARSVIATLVKLRLKGRVILVGHSLGGLVSVEVAKRYPVLVKSLILCSPPFYDETSDKNRFLKTAFKHVQKRPGQFVRLAKIAAKYNLINKSFEVTSDNIKPYLATLRASILTQTSLHDATKLNKRMIMIFGTLDPWVKRRNLKKVAHENPKAEMHTILAGHEVRGPYVDEVVRAVKQLTR